MSFAVSWSDEATSRVDAAWHASDDSGKRDIEQALTTISRWLVERPVKVGESRASDFQRVVTHQPVTLVCSIDPRLRTVYVFAATVARRRG